jgi:hypothetical protein
MAGFTQKACKGAPEEERTQFRVETCCGNKMRKNLIALIIGGCVCKNFFYFYSKYYPLVLTSDRRFY